MQSKSAGLLTTGGVPEWARVTIFRRKNGRRRFNGCNSETKGDIVMGPTKKMVVAHILVGCGVRAALGIERQPTLLSKQSKSA